MKLLLYCNERAIGSLDTDGDASAPVNSPAGNAWQLQFDTAPGTPLSPHLSATAGAVVNAPAVRDFFVNYLPEPPHAGRVARSFRPAPRTEAELLAALGQELTGAFALAPGPLGNARYAPLAFDAFEERVAASRRSADVIAFAPHAPRLLDEYRPGWFEAAHWRELARLAGVTPAYLAAEARRMIEVMQRTAPALAVELRAALTTDELDFLAERVNPVVCERCTWLQHALA